MALLAVASVQAQKLEQDTPLGWATVTGRVLDFDGRPLVGAEISVFPLDVAASGISPRRPITDREGRYRLVTPAYEGRTRLCAVKESAGYPDTQALLFVSGTETKESMPEIHLSPDTHITNIDIRLGPPDGTLEGSVVDAKTGAVVPKSRITMRRLDLEGATFSTSLYPQGHFLFALPATPIEITVVAPGYSPWKYQDSKSGTTSLVLIPPEHRTITVELTPD